MIGLFDSGVGGLYTLKALRARLPNADLCYFADEGNLPYGPRDAQTLLRLSSRAMRFLLEAGAGAILVACGTVSATVYPRLCRDARVKIFDAITPLFAAAAAFAPALSHPRYLFLATEGTVKATTLPAALAAARGATVISLPAPAFVFLAERLAGESKEAVQSAVCKVLAPVLGERFDAILLGCTHFSALQAPISEALSAPVLDGATLAAHAAAENLQTSVQDGHGRVRLYTSGDPPPFERAAARILGEAFPVLGVP